MPGLADHRERSELLVSVVQALSRARDLESIQRIVRTAARELTGADGATFVLRDGDQCFYADEDAIAPLWKGSRFPMSACVSGWAMLERKSAVIEDIYADPRIPADAYRPTFVKSLAMVPIRTSDPIGAIGNYWATRRQPTDEEVALLQALADSTSIAIENVTLLRSLEERVRERTEALEATRREIVERERAEAALKRTEEQLRHAQKMDAVGKLAGGIAHDFNNVLSVILTCSESVIAELERGDPRREDVEEIHRAGERAAALTRQLLAFSRQQVLEPKVNDLNVIVHGLERMLARLIGSSIELQVHAGVGLNPILVDANQLEQVLMNLVVNARDAMPDGGKLSIETQNVRLDTAYADAHHEVVPGDYVMLAVSDTGHGMPPEVQARIFEPFFTTKEAGKGTGIGLATVYGIVRQSGGTVWVYSEPGHGTTFKVYLPRHGAASATETAARVAVTRLTGSETILLVEDDVHVRAVARGILAKAGYHVVECKNADEALLVCEQHSQPIDLLVTDIVMPQMTGVALARHLRTMRPSMRVLCMSGFTDESVLRHGVIDTSLSFVQKPITTEALLTKARQVLDA